MLRLILIRSSWYCAVVAPVSSLTSKNSVSPTFRRIVSQLAGLGSQVPSPCGSTLEFDHEDGGLVVLGEAEVHQHRIIEPGSAFRRGRLLFCSSPSVEPKRTVSEYSS